MLKENVYFFMREVSLGKKSIVLVYNFFYKNKY